MAQRLTGSSQNLKCLFHLDDEFPVVLAHVLLEILLHGINGLSGDLQESAVRSRGAADERIGVNKLLPDAHRQYQQILCVRKAN